MSQQLQPINDLHHSHYRRPRHQDQTPTRKATPSLYQTSTITHKYKSSVAKQKHNSQLHQDVDIKNLAKKSSWNNTSSLLPRSRNGRESGKRRDLAGVRKPQQYLIASSVTHSITPSEVRYRPNLQHKFPIKTHRFNRIVKNFTGSIPNSSAGHFFQFNENVLNSGSLLSSSKSINTTKLINPQKIDRKEAKKLCDSFKLSSYQRRKCRKDSGLPQVLAKATHIAAAECIYQFRYERWNCSLGTSRLHLLNKGTN